MTKMSAKKFKEDEKSVHGEKKHFLSFLKVFQLPETVSDLRVHLWRIFTRLVHFFVFRGFVSFVFLEHMIKYKKT